MDVFRRNGFDFVEAPAAPGSDASGSTGSVDNLDGGFEVTAGASANVPSTTKTTTGTTLLLSAVPLSRNTTLGAEDVAELVAKLREADVVGGVGGGGEGGAGLDAGKAAVTVALLRPSRVRALLASRACRSSIMVGRPLDVPAMGKVLAGLAALHQPWNCPHGRPTMRHVCVLP